MEIKSSPFFAQAKLMLRALSTVLEEECFALKGGSAINLFFRDMPRLSVDIDLTYLPVEERETSLANINAALSRIAIKLGKHLPNSQIQAAQLKAPEMTSKLLVRQQGAQIKIEPNLVIRGTVFPCEEKVLSEKAQKVFEMSVSARAVSFADTFGGKICAALDRQHPRDLYDVNFLLGDQGVTEPVRKAFIVYLISHDRPMHELLNPKMKDFRRVYETEFQGMADETVSCEDLVKTRSSLVDILKQQLSQNEKEFLISFKKGAPDWQLLGIERVENLPAVRWKQMNIQRMDETKKKVSVEKLRASFS